MIKIKGAGSLTRRSDSDHEEAGAIGGGHDLVAIDDDRRAGFDGNAAQPGFSRQSHGPRSDRRPIGARLLAGLFELDENAAGPVAV